MATKLNIDPLIARFVRGQDADVVAAMARWEALIRQRKAENKETWSSTSILLIDHFLALPTPNAAEIERVGRFFYGITHGHPWTEQDGNDGSLSDLLARDLNGKNGYRWAGGIARSKVYMLGDIAWDSSNDGYDGLAEWLSGPHCPASVRGRLAANCMRRLCQYLDNPMLYSDYLEYPRERQRNYANLERATPDRVARFHHWCGTYELGEPLKEARLLLGQEALETLLGETVRRQGQKLTPWESNRASGHDGYHALIPTFLTGFGPTFPDHSSE